MSEVDAGAGAEVEVHVNPLVHVVAPLAAIGATMLARKMLNTGYRRITGGAAPVPDDPRTSFVRAVLWAATTAATAAIVEVAVYRIVTSAGTRRSSS